jgi:hypothetical protein
MPAPRRGRAAPGIAAAPAARPRPAPASRRHASRFISGAFLAAAEPQQLAAGARESLSDRVLAAREHACDLGGSTPFHHAQQEHLAIRRGQAGEGGTGSRGLPAGVSLIVDASLRGASFGTQLLPATCLAGEGAKAVSVLVARDGEEPGQKLGVLPQAVSVAGGREPGFLEEILRVRRGQPGQESPNAIAVPFVEQRKGAWLPAAQGEHQVAISVHTWD